MTLPAGKTIPHFGEWKKTSKLASQPPGQKSTASTTCSLNSLVGWLFPAWSGYSVQQQQKTKEKKKTKKTRISSSNRAAARPGFSTPGGTCRPTTDDRCSQARASDRASGNNAAMMSPLQPWRHHFTVLPRIRQNSDRRRLKGFFGSFLWLVLSFISYRISCCSSLLFTRSRLSNTYANSSLPPSLSPPPLFFFSLFF